MSSFYTQDELAAIGFHSYGKNVLISSKVSIYGPEKMKFGNDVRIDDFCILSGEISVGSHVHISAYTALYGSKGIYIEDYSGLSPRCTVFSATDDFSGEFLIGPMVVEKYTNVIGGSVYIKKFVQVGASCIILPDLTIEEGVAIGAMSLITRSFDGWNIIAGVPAKILKKRSKKLLKFIKDDDK